MTDIEDDARKNFNRKGLPKGYDPIAPEHILGYVSPPVRMRPAGSVSEAASAYGPMIAYLAAFAGLSYLVLRQTEPRENPSRYELVLVSKHGGDTSPHDTIADAKKRAREILKYQSAHLRIVDRHTGKTVWSTGPGAFEGSPATRIPRPNPPVEAGTWTAALQQHVAALLDRTGSLSTRTRFRHVNGILLATRVHLFPPQRRAVERDADQYGYRVEFAPEGDYFWSLWISHPMLAGL